MREEELRQVLLVKAIEETDAGGALIPTADRLAASREAKRNIGSSRGSHDALLAARAQRLLPRIVERHPFVQTVLALVRGPAWLGWLVLAVSLVTGFGLSALDGTRRIDILSFPLLGLVVWNLAVYAATAFAAFRKGSRGVALRGGFSGVLAHAGVTQASRVIARSRAFDAAMSAALARFSREWYQAARPLLVLRASRVLHVGAAVVGIGLIAGLYLRGLAFDYRAGWDSTFLDAAQVRGVLSVVYEPAARLTGITLPEASHLETIRWRNGGGENAAGWIHLLAATTALFIVAPRLLMALLATLGIARLSRRAPVPSEFAGYYRSVFGGSGPGERSTTLVIPYAYQPKGNTLARLRTLLAGEHGEQLALEVQPLVRYGDEDAFVSSVRAREGGPADRVVLLMSLAATPEDENHGALISELREWLSATSPATEVVVVVDEAPYAARMSSEGGAQSRVEERRRTWREFISARGVKPVFADLSS